MTVKHYFLDGNNSQGYTTLLKHVVTSVDNLYMVNGSIRKEKTALLKKISEVFESTNLQVQWLHNPSDEEELDGIIIPDRKTAIIDGSGRNQLAEKYSSFIKDTFDLDVALNKQKVLTHKNSIIALQQKYEDMHDEAYQKFAKGREIHEKKEALYIAAMDFEKANKVTAQLAANLFHDVQVETEQPVVEQLFFGAATPNGAINFIDNITEDLTKRYIIKGRSGSGKSTLMRKIGKYAENVGLQVQYFPCGLDRNSLDMIVIPTLSTAILDGTAPHVIDPTRQTDEVVDMFELCMDKNVEDTFGKEFDQLHEQYKQQMAEGTKLLRDAKDTYHVIEDYYVAALNRSILNQKLEEILSHFK